jgi:hypothetical protein
MIVGAGSEKKVLPMHTLFESLQNGASPEVHEKLLHVRDMSSLPDEERMYLEAESRELLHQSVRLYG